PRAGRCRSWRSREAPYWNESVEFNAVEPNLVERIRHRGPLPALLGELGQTAIRDAVVLAPPSPSHRLPARLHIAETLKPVQQRVEQPFGPVELSTGELVDPPEDGVAVALPLSEDAQHHRGCRGGHEVLGKFHVTTTQA